MTPAQHPTPILTEVASDFSLAEFHAEDDSFDAHQVHLSTNHCIYAEFKQSLSLYIYKLALPLVDKLQHHAIKAKHMLAYAETPLGDSPKRILRNFPTKPAQSGTTEAPRHTHRHKMPLTLALHHPKSHYILTCSSDANSWLQIWDYKEHEHHSSQKPNYKLVIEQDFLRQVQFAKWLDAKTILVVTAHSVYYWWMKKKSVPTLIAHLDKKISKHSLHCHHASVNVGKTELILTFTDHSRRTSLAQYFRLKDSYSKIYKAHTCDFLRYRVKNQRSLPLLLTSFKSPDHNLYFTTIPLSEQQIIPKKKSILTVNEKPKDYPISIHPVPLYGLCFMVTRFGFLSIVDIKTNTQIHSCRFSRVSIAHTITIEQGFFAICTNGACITTFLESNALLSYAAQNLQAVLPSFENTLVARMEYKPPLFNAQKSSEVLDKYKKIMKLKSMKSLHLLDPPQKSATSETAEKKPMEKQNSDVEERIKQLEAFSQQLMHKLAEKEKMEKTEAAPSKTTSETPAEKAPQESVQSSSSRTEESSHPTSSSPHPELEEEKKKSPVQREESDIVQKEQPLEKESPTQNEKEPVHVAPEATKPSSPPVQEEEEIQKSSSQEETPPDAPVVREEEEVKTIQNEAAPLESKIDTQVQSNTPETQETPAEAPSSQSSADDSKTTDLSSSLEQKTKVPKQLTPPSSAESIKRKQKEMQEMKERELIRLKQLEDAYNEREAKKKTATSSTKISDEDEQAKREENSQDTQIDATTNSPPSDMKQTPIEESKETSNEPDVQTETISPKEKPEQDDLREKRSTSKPPQDEASKSPEPQETDTKSHEETTLKASHERSVPIVSATSPKENASSKISLTKPPSPDIRREQSSSPTLELNTQEDSQTPPQPEIHLESDDVVSSPSLSTSTKVLPLKKEWPTHRSSPPFKKNSTEDYRERAPALAKRESFFRDQAALMQEPSDTQASNRHAWKSSGGISSQPSLLSRKPPLVPSLISLRETKSFQSSPFELPKRRKDSLAPLSSPSSSPLGIVEPSFDFYVKKVQSISDQMLAQRRKNSLPKSLPPLEQKRKK